MQEYLLYNCTKVLHPLPQSSNLNSIKNLWNELDNKIIKSTINLKIELKTKLKEECPELYFFKISRKKIIFDMPKCLHEVIKQKEFATK